MRNPLCSPLSNAVFGGVDSRWRLLERDEWRHLQFPPHLADQVFRIAFAPHPGTHIFEIVVSEQCPKDAYTRLGKGLRHLGCASAVINVVHNRSSHAHLMFWRAGRPQQCHHLDVDFSHLSRFDQYVLEQLKPVTPAKLTELFRLLEGKNLGESFFKTLKRHLRRIPPTNDRAYGGLVDLVLKLIFLIFVQRKGWLNFDPFYLETKMAACHAKGLSLVHCLFKPLFARLEGMRIRETLDLGALPRLGGGLFVFQPERLPPIDNEWVLDLYESLVSGYSFSLFEAREGRNVLGVSPEVLGHVFENLLIHKDRKTQGTFYTPMAVAERQVRAGFDAYLKTNGLRDNPRLLKQRLRELRVLDPSCGSGTYLLAAFQTLLKFRLELAPRGERYNGKLYALKRSIILHNLYGLDINPMAVRLTEVRLWLNMIQDLEVSEPAQAPALPSLQHHIRPGDFLFRQPPGDVAVMRRWSKYEKLEALRDKFPHSSALRRQALLKHMLRLERELAHFLDEREAKAERETLRTRLNQHMLPGHQRSPENLRVSRRGTPRDQLHIIFSQVMLRGGFDLILGNPPWRSAVAMSARQKQHIRRHQDLPPGLTWKGQTDLSLYFLSASLPLLKPKGHLGLLMPGKLLQAQYAAPVRAYLEQHFQMDYLFDYGIDQHLIFQADTFPVALGLSKTKPNREGRIHIEREGKDLQQSFQLRQETLANRAMWILGDAAQMAWLEETRHWHCLKDLPLRIRRGIVTHAKRYFVFSRKPDHLPAANVRPLLRGRDIQAHSVSPGQWIYWPFGAGPEWFSKVTPRELAWLRRTGRLRERGGLARLGYGPKPMGPWIVIWKYLAKRWTVALLRAGDWVPDQTTYYINFCDFALAYRYFAYFRSKLAGEYLRLIAERGKDRYFFYYAHTCEALVVPPDLERRTMVIPEPREIMPDEPIPSNENLVAPPREMET